jgi:hypothetical protein
MKKLSKFLATFAVTASIGFSAPSNATGIPMVDIANLAENIAGNIQSAYQWAEEKMIALSQMDLQSMLSGYEIDSMNNAMSNVIVRVNKAMEDVYNQKVVEMAKPDRDACKNLSVRLTLDDIMCAMSDEKAANATARMAAIKANSAASVTPAEHMTYVAQEINKMKTSCMSMAINGGTSLLETECARIENVTQGPAVNASADDAAKSKAASVEAIKAMTNQQVPRATTSPDLPDTVVANASRANDLRFLGYKGLAVDSLNTVNGMVQVATGMEGSPTPLQTLKKFDDDHWGSTDWMQEITNTGATKLSDPVSDTELQRRMTTMTAFSIHMTMLQYEHQLRMERLAAAQLDLQIDPFKD